MISIAEHVFLFSPGGELCERGYVFEGVGGIDRRFGSGVGTILLLSEWEVALMVVLGIVSIVIVFLNRCCRPATEILIHPKLKFADGYNSPPPFHPSPLPSPPLPTN